MSIVVDLKKLASRRTLLWIWTLREIRIRYKQSALGVLWAVLQPVSLMIVLTVVFSIFARVPSDGIPYPLFSLTALLPWMFFSNALNGAVTSLTNNMSLIQKIYFPREILPLGTVLAALFDLVVASLALLPLFFYYSIPVPISILWLPVLVLTQLALVLGCALPLAALCVRFRDIRFVVPLVLQLWFFASPVIYPVSMVPERFQWLYLANPLAGLIGSYRKVSLKAEGPDPLTLLVGALVAVSLLVVGYVFFKRREPEFADII